MVVIAPYLVEVHTPMDDLHATFAVYLSRDHNSYHSRPHDEANWILFSSKARSKDRSGKKESWSTYVAKTTAH